MNRASLKGMSFTMSSPDEAVQGLAMPDEGGHAPLQRCERAASTCSTPEDTQHRLIHLLQSRGAMFTSGRSPLKGCGVAMGRHLGQQSSQRTGRFRCHSSPQRHQPRTRFVQPTRPIPARLPRRAQSS
jgi:hypothetical protein